MSRNPIYMRFIDAVADSLQMSFDDLNDNYASLLYGRASAGPIDVGRAEAFFTVTPDFDNLKVLIEESTVDAPLTEEELQELKGHEFIVKVELLE